MNIEKLNQPVGPANLGGASAAKSERSASTGGAPAASDQVALSPLAAQLSDLAASLAASPAVDRTRVDEIKSAISEGRLQVDPSVVADKLIETVRQLLAPRNP
ncbi:MAG: flagellar biosynthesis anti-sigma factor FlgM [Betaproteobacteria bacterium]|nr:flagellar biosynthesis anti-sigma factor FlgM [Betaproteobacteria bacterium]